MQLLFLYIIYTLEWCPSVTRRKGRPRNSWMQEVITGMKEKGINNMYSTYHSVHLLRLDETQSKAKIGKFVF